MCNQLAMVIIKSNLSRLRLGVDFQMSYKKPLILITMARLLGTSTCRVENLARDTIGGHILLGGGTGFIGSAFHYLLKTNGYNVTVISRMPGPQRMTWFDVSEKGIPENLKAVVNLSGQNVFDPTSRWTPGFKQNVRNSRINTTHTLAQAISKAKQKPEVFVTISGVGVYKPSVTDVYDENTVLGEPFDFLSELGQEWEDVAKLPPNANVRNVVVRSGIVLGRGGGMIKQMFPAFFFGVGGPIGDGKQYLPWIHLKDLCRLLLFAIENKNVTGVLNGVAPEIVTNGEFTSVFASALWRPAFFRVPEFALNMLFGNERAKIMTEGQKVIPKRTLEYGFNFEYPNIKSACSDCAKLMYSAKEPFKL